MLDKHLSCYFSISVEDILEDDINGILDGVSAEIAQGSYLICIDSCEHFLS